MMSGYPKVSVLTTVFNRAKFLGDCIESVQQSRFMDYEHIIVDDGSTDDSVEIAQRYAKKDPRIKVFVNETNLGDYPNRNEAARHASGTYLKYLDADDLHGPYILDVLVDCMQSFPLAGLGLFVHGEGSTHSPKCLSPDEVFNLHYRKKIGILNRSPLGAVIKRTTFELLGGFPENQHVGDFEFWHRMAANGSVVLLPSNLAHYRVHADQQSADNRSDLRVPFKYFDAAIRGLQSNHENKLSEKTLHDTLGEIRQKQARTILVLLRRAKFRLAIQLKRQSKLSWSALISNAK
jgi:glycosyltransferase involved in cell wall biosynthesis